MSLEKIKGIRQEINRLNQESLSYREKVEIISDINLKYKSLITENGIKYCLKKCPDIPLEINRLIESVIEYNS